MALSIDVPGVQTLIQGAPRMGLRHWGVPRSGPADPLSHALANRLVGEPLDGAALEIALGPASIGFEAPTAFAVTGAEASLSLSGDAIEAHRTVLAKAGDTLHIGPVSAGARLYLAVAGGVVADTVLGSPSTYSPAGFGGHQGRALLSGDRIAFAMPDAHLRLVSDATPIDLRPPMGAAWALRACEGAEFDRLDDASRGVVFDRDFHVGARTDRMGVSLDGAVLGVRSDGRMASAPVFPGTVQCPEDGRPFLLGVDAQTTGGYARILHVTRADRHLIGQVKSGDGLRFLHRTPSRAAQDYRAKRARIAEWLRGDPL